jgi:hypothetical protein
MYFLLVVWNKNDFLGLLYIVYIIYLLEALGVGPHVIKFAPFPSASHSCREYQNPCRECVAVTATQDGEGPPPPEDLLGFPFLDSSSSRKGILYF